LNLTVDGILEGARQVRVEVGDQLFLNVGPVDGGIGVGRHELDLGFCDVDRGADTVLDKVQVGNHLDGFGRVRGPAVVTLAAG